MHTPCALSPLLSPPPPPNILPLPPLSPLLAFPPLAFFTHPTSSLPGSAPLCITLSLGSSSFSTSCVLLLVPPTPPPPSYPASPGSSLSSRQRKDKGRQAAAGTGSEDVANGGHESNQQSIPTGDARARSTTQHNVHKDEDGDVRQSDHPSRCVYTQSKHQGSH
ncbi:hypothetical protein Q8A73_006453 [Channa argus]|nr:hypothetical protein Q8A73_006453 [Channa argus]